MGINFQGYGSEIHGQNNDDPSIQNIPIENCTSMNIKYGGWWKRNYENWYFIANIDKTTVNDPYRSGYNKYRLMTIKNL